MVIDIFVSTHLLHREMLGFGINTKVCRPCCPHN
jgi:hypothetical protein